MKEPAACTTNSQALKVARFCTMWLMDMKRVLADALDDVTATDAEPTLNGIVSK